MGQRMPKLLQERPGEEEQILLGKSGARKVSLSLRWPFPGDKSTQAEARGEAGETEVSLCEGSTGNLSHSGKRMAESQLEEQVGKRMLTLWGRIDGICRE